MTPIEFERRHAERWRELEAVLATKGAFRKPSFAADRFVALYRAACEHLAVARSRGYPVAMIDRLEALTTEAHQRIYATADTGWRRLGRLFLLDFPQAVRRHRLAVALALAVFALPLVATGYAAWRDPGFVLALHDIDAVSEYDRMYGESDHALGRRDAASDWAMFGIYIRNNIGIAFQCFASGIFLGIGSLFFLAYNGLVAGSLAGYLTWRGHGENFYSFVVGHGAFELPAIVLAGAAGLALGGALLAPGRRSRLHALRDAAAEAIVIVYGVIAMLVVAAAVEAFWSSQRWVDPVVKYGVGGAAWVAVIAYLCLQGRPRRTGP